MKIKILSLVALLSCAFFSEAFCTDSNDNAYQQELNELTLILVKYGNNPRGLPPLLYAIEKNDIEAVDLLLKYGADLFTSKGGEESCLHHAILAGSIPLVQKFIDLGYDPRDIYHHDGDHNALFCNAVDASLHYHNYDIAKYLLEKGYYNHTSLYGACYHMVIYPYDYFPKEIKKSLFCCF